MSDDNNNMNRAAESAEDKKRKVEQMDESDTKRARIKEEVVVPNIKQEMPIIKQETPIIKQEIPISKQETLNEEDEVLDLALTFGYEPGLRLEVEWDVVRDNETDNHDDETDHEPTMTTRWWGATLLSHDGRVEDSVAVRTLEYDAYPEGGFPEKTKEDVIIIGQGTLCDPNTQEIMAYRLEGEEDAWFSGDRTDLEDAVDTCLMSAMEKHKDKWDKLTPAQQAEIGSMMSSHKEKFVDLLTTHTVITPEVVKDLLAKVQYDAATK
jgi:hypothetical protein